jgi:hypothetical protein
VTTGAMLEAEAVVASWDVVLIEIGLVAVATVS